MRHKEIPCSGLAAQREAENVEFVDEHFETWAVSITVKPEAKSFWGEHTKLYIDGPVLLAILHEIEQQPIEFGDSEVVKMTFEEYAWEYFDQLIYDKLCLHLDDDADQAMEMLSIEVYETHQHGGL